MPKDLICPICGVIMRRIQNNAKYCSDRCRQQAFRDKRKQERQGEDIARP